MKALEYNKNGFISKHGVRKAVLKKAIICNYKGKEYYIW